MSHYMSKVTSLGYLFYFFPKMYNFILTSDSDIEIKPMNINRRIILDSEDEDNSAMNNKLTNRKKRRRIIEVESSSDKDIVIENLDSAEQNKGKYMQRINKITRNTGQKYYTKREKFIPAKKFESKNCNCSKKCIKRLNETQRKAIFDKFWNIGDFNKQNVLNILDARPITYEKYKDIKRLLPYIPPVHHAYFETLPHAEHKRVNTIYIL